MDGHVARAGETRNAYNISLGRFEERPFGRPRRRLEDNIRMDLRKIGWECVIGFIWLRIGTNGGPRERDNAFRSQKRQGIS
jgi:hypothetical protein